ncbi:Chalcone synthase 1, partial [Cucurbita argyrosperma subsp. sororia]
MAIRVKLGLLLDALAHWAFLIGTRLLDRASWWAVDLGRIKMESGLGLEKLRASRHVTRESGNMSGAACVLFILDRMRKKSSENGLMTAGMGWNGVY